jgi:hypothetical protein
MPQPFKPRRRRGPAGPNKNEKKVLREERSRGGVTLGQMFPTVQKLTVQVDFLTPQEELLDQQTLTFGARDVFGLTLPCQGRCGSGEFDLSGKVRSVVETRQTQAEGRGVCQEPLFNGSKDPCGFHMRCRIDVSYTPSQA